MTSESRWRIRVGTAIGVACVIGAGIAFATIPDGSGAIHGCYTKSTGTIRIIDSTVTNCKSGETALTWNNTGPMGPAGPAGATGPAGPAGAQGEPGDDNVIAFGVSGLNKTKTVAVADLGDVTVGCSDVGVATAGFTTPDSVQFRQDLTPLQGVTETSFGKSLTGRSYTALSFGELPTLLIDKPGVGMWKVEFNPNANYPLPPVMECMSAAVITVMQ